MYIKQAINKGIALVAFINFYGAYFKYCLGTQFQFSRLLNEIKGMNDLFVSNNSFAMTNNNE